MKVEIELFDNDTAEVVVADFDGEGDRVPVLRAHVRPGWNDPVVTLSNGDHLWEPGITKSLVRGLCGSLARNCEQLSRQVTEARLDKEAADAPAP
jgi:hypothetical protein